MKSPSASVELPDPDPAIILWRIAIEAHISTLSRRKAERFLTAMAEKLADEENLSQVFSIRPNSERAAVQKARLQAAELLSRYLPIFLASIPRR